MASTARYTDKFLNALMDPHHIYVRVELWYNNAPVGLPLTLVSGSISADRTGYVRRTATLNIDPNAVNDPVIGPLLNPYGSIVKVYRGIRYPDNSTDGQQVFTGRIDAVSRSIDSVQLTCSDMASYVVDARFTRPYTLPNAANIYTTAANLITGAFSPTGFNPLPTVTNDIPVGSRSTLTTTGGQNFEQERTEAVNSLMKVVGAEWMADVTGNFRIKAMPAVISAGTVPVWIVDSGDSGVMVTNVVNVDRANIFNYVIAEGEPVGGVTPAHGEWSDTTTTSKTYINGPFGQATGYFTGQPLTTAPGGNTTQAANDLAAVLGANSVAKAEQVQVSCIPNPKLMLGDVVRVLSTRAKIDKMYFVQSFELPLDPETPMTMTLYQTLTAAGTTEAGQTVFEPSPLRVPEGSTWQPHP